MSGTPLASARRRISRRPGSSDVSTATTSLPHSSYGKVAFAAVVRHPRAAGRAERGLERPGRVVETGVYDAAVARGLVLRERGFLLDDRTRRPETASARAVASPTMPPPTTTASKLGVAVEEAGDRAVVEDLADRAGEQRRDRQHGELVEPLVVGDRQRVGDDDLADAASSSAGRRPGRRARAWVAATMTSAAPLSNSASAALVIVPPVSIMSSTRMQVRPGDVTDDAVGDLTSLGTSGRGVLWMNASGAPPSRSVQRSATRTRPASGATTVTSVASTLGLDVVGEQRQREQVVDRAVEEALDLRGVQVDGHQPVGAGGLEQVGDQPGGDRLAAAVLLVLPGVGVERHDHGDALGRGALERVDHDQLLHHPGVDRRGVALEDEGVAAADRLLEADEDLAVGEVVGAASGSSSMPSSAATSSASSGWARPEKSIRFFSPLVLMPRHCALPCSLGRSVVIALLRRPRRGGRGRRRPGRGAATQPSMLRCFARPTPSAPGGTSSVMTDPAAV